MMERTRVIPVALVMEGGSKETRVSISDRGIAWFFTVQCLMISKANSNRIMSNKEEDLLIYFFSPPQKKPHLNTLVYVVNCGIGERIA
ncbi:hypothetical protein TNCV_949131 [Trichonephila clavipes]|nr:hypothetical protein TNCV_949131 [Trichonephila clavipes]